MSSDSETLSSVKYENISEGIIIEVKKRPGLYDRSLKKFNDRKVRARLWQEVYKNVCRDWAELSEDEKKYKGSIVQKKWKNMKDCFAKEYAARQEQAGKPLPTKRKYVHYDALLFMIPFLQKRDNGRPISSSLSTQNSEGDSDALQSPVHTQTVEHNIANRKRNQSRGNLAESEQQSRDSSKDKNAEDEDEERNFALMLVPMLRKLNEDQKHFAKVEILNVLKKARSQ